MKRKKLFTKSGRRALSVLATALTFYEVLLAQSGSAGVSAINDAASDIRSFYDPIKKLIWIIAAVVGVVGAVRVYGKIMGKDPESTKHAQAFVFGAIALVALETFVRKMFLES
jgi:hypothetical protein